MRKQGLILLALSLMLAVWVSVSHTGCSDGRPATERSGLRGYMNPRGGDNPFESNGPQNNPFETDQPQNNPFEADQPQNNPHEADQPQDNPYESSDEPHPGEDGDIQDLLDEIEDILDEMEEADPEEMDELMDELSDILGYDVGKCWSEGRDPCAFECCPEGLHCNYDTGECDGGGSSDDDSGSGDINQELEDLWDEMSQVDDYSELEDLMDDLSDELGYDIMDCVMEGGVPCTNECCKLGDMCNYDNGKCETAEYMMR